MDALELEEKEKCLYEKALALSLEGNSQYAALLCQEILNRAPDYIEVRRLLLELREKNPPTKKFQQKVRIFSHFIELLGSILLHSKEKKRDLLIALDSLLELYPQCKIIWRFMSRLSLQLEYFNTAIFCIEIIPENKRNLSDFICLGEAYLSCGYFEEATKIANFILEKNPENSKAHNLLWKSSIEDTLTKQP